MTTQLDRPAAPPATYPASKALYEAARGFTTEGVQHAGRFQKPHPIYMERAQGSRIWDADGNEYIDFSLGSGPLLLGHGHPKVVHAIRDAADRFLHVSSDWWHEGQVRLAERLALIAPMGEAAMSFFCQSGTESVEAALKLARHVTGRPRFIGFLGGFHGRTMGSLSFTSSKYTQQQGFFPTMPGVTLVPYPNSYRPLLRGDDQGRAVCRERGHMQLAGAHQRRNPRGDRGQLILLAGTARQAQQLREVGHQPVG